MPGKIFVSARRKHVKESAACIHDRLSAVFGSAGLGMAGALFCVRPARLQRAIFPVAVLCLVASSLIFHPANAQSNVSARLEWYGTYAIKNTEETNDPASPGGHRVVTTPIPPKSNIDRIPGRQGVRFGFSYVLSGGTSQDVAVKHVVRFPQGGMPVAQTGGGVTFYSRPQTSRIGEPEVLGWSFEGASPERILIGEWTFELWQGDRKLLERRFTVYRP